MTNKYHTKVKQKFSLSNMKIACWFHWTIAKLLKGHKRQTKC